jgi:hypothetical protein
MRAILIDPVAEKISETEFDGDYRSIYRLLSDPEYHLNVTTFTAIYITNRDSLFVDDNGLLTAPRYFFKWRDYRQPLAGRGLILGLRSSDGENIATKLSLAHVKNMVTFHRLSVKGFDHGDYTTDAGVGVIWSRPRFGPPEDA